MGLYDQVSVTGEWCRCSEGHDLRGEPLQTKDLGCTMGDWVLGEELQGEPGGHGRPETMPFSGTLSAYTFCRFCPAFLQLETWNVLSAWVEFEVELEGGRVVAVRRVSEDFADWMESERAAGSIGPMTLDQAAAESRARRESSR